MIGLVLVLALAQEVEPVPAPPPPPPCPWTLALRSGVWSLGDFRATLPAGSREFTREALLDLGLDLGVSFDGWFVALSGDYAASGQLSATSLGLRGGYACDVGCLFDRPLQLAASAGVLAATLEVDESRFGDFDAGIGGLGRLDLVWDSGAGVRGGLWAELRAVEFDFQPAVVGGDEAAGGTTFALGLSVAFGF